MNRKSKRLISVLTLAVLAFTIQMVSLAATPTAGVGAPSASLTAQPIG